MILRYVGLSFGCGYRVEGVGCEVWDETCWEG